MVRNEYYCQRCDTTALYDTRSGVKPNTCITDDCYGTGEDLEVRLSAPSVHTGHSGSGRSSFGELVPAILVIDPSSGIAALFTHEEMGPPIDKRKLH